MRPNNFFQAAQSQKTLITIHPEASLRINQKKYLSCQLTIESTELQLAGNNSQSPFTAEEMPRAIAAARLRSRLRNKLALTFQINNDYNWQLVRQEDDNSHRITVYYTPENVQFYRDTFKKFIDEINKWPDITLTELPPEFVEQTDNTNHPDTVPARLN